MWHSTCSKILCVVECLATESELTHSRQSLRVRNGYIDQLRTLDLVSRHLLPSLCLILHIGHSRVKPPKLDLWEIDTFYIPCE